MEEENHVQLLRIAREISQSNKGSVSAEVPQNVEGEREWSREIRERGHWMAGPCWCGKGHDLVEGREAPGK